MKPRRMRSEPDDVVASPVLHTRESYVDVDGCSGHETNDEKGSAACPARLRCSRSRGRMAGPVPALRGHARGPTRGWKQPSAPCRRACDQ
jgi:hypothetical protein